MYFVKNKCYCYLTILLSLQHLNIFPFPFLTQTGDFCFNPTSNPYYNHNLWKNPGPYLEISTTTPFGFYAFRGIPYAKPPLKELRFQPPLKPDPWNNVKKCEHFGHMCPQISPINGSFLGNENCLTLNIFTKDLNESNPVMVWFHAGAHIRGSGAMLGPDYLMEKAIVLVTVNFRLNIFGFFSTNDENAYGNVALKDQIAALEWVQENIANFGGDRSRVTIFGESSGSDCVSLLQLSSRTKGLFHQIIGESGSALNPRYLQRNPLKYVYNIAKYFNVSTETNENIVEGLRKIDCEELTRAANSSEIMGYAMGLGAMPFYPIIEAENRNAIITQSPYELLESGNFNKIPFIFGYNTNEGSLGLKIVKAEMKIEDFDRYYELFAPQSLDDENERKSVGKIVRDFFLGNASAKCTEKFLEFLGQELQVRGIRKMVDLQRKYTEDGYFYRFSYKGTHTVEYNGVGHGEELQYIFVREGTRHNLTERDLITRKRMIEMWTNFATFGSPTPSKMDNITWEKCSNNTSVNFLDIGTNLISGINPDDEVYQFWLNLFKNYIKNPETF